MREVLYCAMRQPEELSLGVGGLTSNRATVPHAQPSPLHLFLRCVYSIVNFRTHIGIYSLRGSSSSSRSTQRGLFFKTRHWSNQLVVGVQERGPCGRKIYP